jgi:hypothetical protein
MMQVSISTNAASSAMCGGQHHHNDVVMRLQHHNGEQIEGVRHDYILCEFGLFERRLTGDFYETPCTAVSATWYRTHYTMADEYFFIANR